MQQEVFDHLPAAGLDAYRRKLLKQSINLLQDYWSGDTGRWPRLVASLPEGLLWRTV